jgi:hypothetical protein
MVITEPNKFVAEVHDRLPVILEAKDFEHWGRGDVKDAALMKPAGEGVLQKWAVSRGNEALARGFTVHQQFVCVHCDAEQTMGEPNVLYESGMCEECGKVTNLRERDCPLWVRRRCLEHLGSTERKRRDRDVDGDADQ